MKEMAKNPELAHIEEDKKREFEGRKLLLCKKSSQWDFKRIVNVYHICSAAGEEKRN
jgi:hypothetical protein